LVAYLEQMIRIGDTRGILDMKITWIEEHRIACGGIPIDIKNLESLREQGICAIVTLTEHPLTAQKALSTEVLAEAGFEVLHVPIVDQFPPSREQAEEVLNFVERVKSENKPVYLHCHAGIGRTGTMLHALYLLSGMPLEDVKQMLKTARPTSQFFMLSDPQKRFLEELAVTLRL
jgi:atypical dual specificity phosphatase